MNYEPVQPCPHPAARVRPAQIWNDAGKIVTNLKRCRDCGIAIGGTR